MPPRHLVLHPDLDLTPAEERVVGLLAAGLGPIQIATHVERSHNTVKAQIRFACHRNEVNITRLVALWVEIYNAGHAPEHVLP